MCERGNVIEVILIKVVYSGGVHKGFNMEELRMMALWHDVIIILNDRFIKGYFREVSDNDVFKWIIHRQPVHYS